MDVVQPLDSGHDEEVADVITVKTEIGPKIFDEQRFMLIEAGLSLRKD